jgi:hypothetical protein
MAAKPIFVQAVDTNGTPYSGAKLNVYDAGTTTPRAIYTESGLGTASANPAIADANGVVVVWVNDAGGDIKVTLTNSAETVTPHNEDNIPIASLTCYPVITFQGDQSLLTTSSPTFAGLTLGNVSFAGVVTDPNADRLVFWDDSAGQVNFMTLGTGLAFNGTALELDGDLQDISGLTPTDGGVIIGDGTDFVVESGSTLRASLGVTIGTHVQAYSAALDIFAANGLTSAELGQLQNIDSTTVSSTQWGYLGSASAYGGSLMAVASEGAFKALVNLEPGTDVLSHDANLQAFVDAFTLPTTDGVAGQVPTTNGAGSLSFQTPAGAGDVLAAANETVTGSWNFTGGLQKGGQSVYAVGDTIAATDGNFGRTLESHFSDLVTPYDFGALGDGSGGTVNEWLTGGAHDRGYADLAAIQVDFPDVVALSDTIDWAATQQAIRAGSDPVASVRNPIRQVKHGVFIPSGDYVWNRTLTVINGTPIFGESMKTSYVTFTASCSVATISSVNTGTDTLTATAHGFSNGDRLFYITDGSDIGGLENGQSYYAVNTATNTLQVSRAPGGTAITLTSTGSGTATLRNDDGDAVHVYGDAYDSGGGARTEESLFGFSIERIQIIPTASSGQRGRALAFIDNDDEFGHANRSCRVREFATEGFAVNLYSEESWTLKVLDCALEDAEAYNIHLRNGTDALLWGNRIDLAGIDNVYIEDGTVDFSFTYTAGTKIWANQIQRAARWGVRARDCESVELSGNFFEKNGESVASGHIYFEDGSNQRGRLFSVRGGHITAVGTVSAAGAAVGVKCDRAKFIEIATDFRSSSMDVGVELGADVVEDFVSSSFASGISNVTRAATDARVGYSASGRKSENAAYTLEESDAGVLITCSNASPVTYTIPADATATLPLGVPVRIANLGSGDLTIQAAAGVYLVDTDGGAEGTASSLVVSRREFVVLIKTAADSWLASKQREFSSDDVTGRTIGLNLKNANYTLGVDDAGKVIRQSSSTNYTYTLPADATADIPDGAIVRICNHGSSTLTVDGESATYVFNEKDGTEGAGNTANGSTTLARNTSLEAHKVGTDTWMLR